VKTTSPVNPPVGVTFIVALPLDPATTATGFAGPVTVNMPLLVTVTVTEVEGPTALKFVSPA
jgi:hypothetical protein